MYLPKIKIKKTSRRVNRPDGGSSISSVIETFDGRLFLGEEFSPDAQELSNSDQLETLSFSARDSIFKTQIQMPSEKDYKQGIFKRYFMQDKRTKNINEISKDTYRSMGPTIYLELLEVEWDLKPPAKDVYFKGKKYEGAESRNKKTIAKASKDIIGLSQYIRDYSQYVPKTNIKKEKFENPQLLPSSFDLPSPSNATILSKVKREERVIIKNEIQENLYASAGQFRNVDTGQEYVGPYHEHPELGAMVGAVHTSEKHSKLEPILYTVEELSPSTETTPEQSTQSNISSGGSTSGASYGGY